MVRFWVLIPRSELHCKVSTRERLVNVQSYKSNKLEKDMGGVVTASEHHRLERPEPRVDVVGQSGFEQAREVH